MTDLANDDFRKDERERREKPLSKDLKECFNLIKQIVNDKNFWNKQGDNSIFGTKTPAQVARLQKASMPKTVGGFEEIMKPIWERKEDKDRSFATNDLYKIIDSLSNENAIGQAISSLKNMLSKTSNAFEVNKGPRIGGKDSL